MTVRLITDIDRYTGLCSDTKPTGVKPGSTFWCYDTNIVFETYDGTNWIAKEVFDMVLNTTVDLNQVAGDYVLYTATVGAVFVTGFTLTLPNVDCSDDAALTSISVQTDMATPDVIISAATGAVANLTALASFTYAGLSFTLTVGKVINLTIAGGAADAATVCDVTARCRSITPLAYLAP